MLALDATVNHHFFESKRLVITGMGVCAANADNRDDLASALREGRCGIGIRDEGPTRATKLGAWLQDIGWPHELTGPPADRARQVLRGTLRFTSVACAVTAEAWEQAQLASNSNPEDIGLVIAGNNCRQSYLADHYQRYAEKLSYIPPRFGVNFLETQLIGVISSVFGLRGPGFTVGAAAGSGNTALYQAAQILRAGEASACVCLAPVCDLSDFELQALANLGAMHPGIVDEDPAQQCRPFDRSRQGFVYGQGAGCVILETLEHATTRQAPILAELAGVSLVMDGNHTGEPSVDGEARAMRRALQQAGVEPGAIDYLNAHGTAAAAGDDAECEAIRQVFGCRSRPWINATKALCGHTFTAAGLIEVIATVIQMWQQFVHPNPNLVEPIDPELHFVRQHVEAADILCAMSNSFGFGGISSSVVLRPFTH